ncbi:hypothetical protein TCAL_11239 [Tigriopus californicus]|uniref:ER membrane protein complex subunit 1 n=1 Tax=Tigriopus californicus TaxID=6832 RepID=A0A553N8D6_TIGCA|nr:hypothetical protein TCAL_11239 [Tigriopus californicus]|eukprot:TCALIF_11239-PA protein Name:"Similar to emc1 ER membrane protein complex subunit 1 (Xenopus laevis)" AED:0.06 eAED:0.06 QI:71/0.5/0.33/1/1/1/3/0/866
MGPVPVRPPTGGRVALWVCLGLVWSGGWLIAPTGALFEDQVFKFDWSRSLVGVPLAGQFWDTPRGQSNFILRTKNRVLASLDSDSGKILWRHVLDDDADELLDLRTTPKLVQAVSWHRESAFLTFRAWHPTTAALKQETTAPLPPGTRVDLAFIHEDEVNALTLADSGSVTVQVLNWRHGSPVRTVTLTSGSGQPLRCIRTPDVLVCLSVSSAMLYYTPLPISPKAAFTAVALDKIGLPVGARPLALQTVPGSSGLAQIAVKVTKLRDFTQNVHEMSFQFSQDVGRLVQAWGACEEDERGSAIFQLVLLTSDGSLTSLTPLGNQMWTREEALASIDKVELVATGLDSGSMEDEGPFQNEATDLVQQFAKRIRHHLALIQSTISHFLELNDWRNVFSGNQDKQLDDFGIRKVILAVCDEGKIFGLDNKNGEVLWNVVYPNVVGEKSYLFIQRTAMHFGTEPMASLIFRNRYSQKFQLLTLDPLSGAILSWEDLKHPVDQAVLLHQHDDKFIRPVLVISKNQVDVVPSSAKASVIKYAEKTFIATKDPQTNDIQGQKLLVNPNGFLVLRPIWSLANPGTEVRKFVGKSTEEDVHSQGRVMADRSVLFKYVNPNLALIISEGTDAAGKLFINVYLVDMVTGRLIFSANHKRVTGPYHVVHSENWAVYTYYNEKSRRAELTSLELFEGNEQTNATVFSSVSDVISPLVERQAFILGPSHISALRDTRTEKGITTKHILMATKTGLVYDIPRQFLDPRRPNMNTPPEMREPGIPPYIPELQLPQEMIINYNQTVGVPRGIITAPTGLESTSVVFVYGLDLYCTRVAPSKGFDLLKDDFDYYVIASVLLALIMASFITKRLSQRKALKQAWK